MLFLFYLSLYFTFIRAINTEILVSRKCFCSVARLFTAYQFDGLFWEITKKVRKITNKVLEKKKVGRQAGRRLSLNTD